MGDNPALFAAADTADYVVPVFIYQDALLRGKHAAPNRNKFLLESLQDLQRSMQELGTDLIVRTGDPASVLTQLAADTGADTVHYTIDYTPFARSRDAVVAEALQTAGIGLHAFPGRLIVDSLQGIQAANGNTYTVFTPFWKNWSRVPRRDVLPAPSSMKLPPGVTSDGLPADDTLYDGSKTSPELLQGGETAGRRRMEDFLSSSIGQYAEMHDTLTPGGTSRLSAYLHMGCISALELESVLPPGEGAARFNRQLAWRDFYNYVLFHYPDNAKEEFQERFRTLDWKEDPALLQAWKDGRTGYPIVDAAMRQLLREGWMHNRTRLITGSFLTKDLQLDWRLGERYFMEMLIDGDQASNNGNWQWIASVGVDPAPVFRRLYNPATQQKRHDPDGTYVRYYVPELAKVPDKYLADPSNMSSDVQLAAGCIIGDDYPAPIVDHAAARLETLDRFRNPGR